MTRRFKDGTSIKVVQGFWKGRTGKIMALDKKLSEVRPTYVVGFDPRPYDQSTWKRMAEDFLDFASAIDALGNIAD
jgi:hypothetical protein